MAEDTLKYWHNGHPIISSNATEVPILKYWDSGHPFVMIYPPPTMPTITGIISITGIGSITL